MRVCDRCGLVYDDEFDVCAFDGGALVRSLVGGRVLAGRYRLERQLAEGAMGQVFEAVHLAVGSRVAVKVMQPQQKDLQVATQRFHKEARILGAVKHPHAVLITDFDIDARPFGAVPFLVTELLRGRSLAALLDEKRTLDLDEVERLVVPLADAVEEAHELSIIHRDLKPSNVFVERLRDGTDVVKVLDFGIAKLLHRVGDDVPAPVRFDDDAAAAALRNEILSALEDDDADGEAVTVHDRKTTPTRQGDVVPLRPGSTWAGMMVGTVPYMAPEQMTGERITRRADVYALAVMIFEMLTGRLPFEGDDDEIIRGKLSDERPSMREHGVDVGGGLDELLMQCFAVNPDERPERVSHVADAVVRAAAARRGAVSDPVGALATRLSSTARALERVLELPASEHDLARDLLLSAGAALQRARTLLPLAKAALSAPPQATLVAAHLELDDVVTSARGVLVPMAHAQPESGARLMLLWRRLDALVSEVAALLEDSSNDDDDALSAVLEPVPLSHTGPSIEQLVAHLVGRDPLDARQALDSLLNDRVDATVRVLHAPSGVSDTLLAGLWQAADAVLLRDLGADRGALRFMPFLAGLSADRTGFVARFQRVIDLLRDRSGAAIVDGVGDGPLDEPLLRCLLLHPIHEVRAKAAARVPLAALWTVAEHPRSPLAVQGVVFQQLKRRGHVDHLKVFFFCVRDAIAGAGHAELREAVALVRGFFDVGAFHEDLLFEPLLELERQLRERAGAAGLLEDSWAHVVAVFVDEGRADETQLEHLRDVPLPLQRKLAREGRFLATFVCHANERIARETLPHLLRLEDVTRYLRQVTIHRVVLVELAKRRRFFKKDPPKLALLSNPKTPAAMARNYIGLVSDEQLRNLSANRHINPDVRRLIQQRLNG